MTILGSEAKRIIENHLRELGLEYQVEVDDPIVVNLKPVDPKDRSKGSVFGEYAAGVTLTDKEGNILKTELYINAQTGELREGSCWNPTKDQYEAGMRGRKQHYVLIVTEDKQTARNLADEMYNQEGVVSSSYGSRSVIDQARDHGVIAFVHGKTNQSGPLQYRVRPEEEQRRESLENSILRNK